MPPHRVPPRRRKPPAAAPDAAAARPDAWSRITVSGALTRWLAAQRRRPDEPLWCVVERLWYRQRAAELAVRRRFGEDASAAVRARRN